MDLILNDFSISGQFDSLEHFLDSIVKYTLPMLSLLNGQGYNLYKTYSAYDLTFFEDTTINHLIQNPKYKAYPEITSLKKMLCTLIEEPYWEDDLHTDRNAEYECEKVGKFSGIKPNCFSEALERRAEILSFEHDEFKDLKVEIVKNKDKHQVFNFFNKSSVGEYLVQNNKINLAEFLLSKYDSKEYSMKIVFHRKGNIYYADEAYVNGKLSYDDLNDIQKDFFMSLKYIEQGNLTSRFTDSISYKKITYYEFRCSLANSREFRIYYCIYNGKYIYFNSLIKKTGTLDSATKEKSITLIKEYMNQNKSR